MKPQWNVLENVRILLVSPILLLYIISGQKAAIDADVRRHIANNDPNGRARLMITMLRIFSEKKEFRSVFYFRLKSQLLTKILARFARCVYREQSCLFINTAQIGPGLLVLHGFSTIVVAEKIGANCTLHQQTTIGWAGSGKKGCPTIGDDVYIGCGAKILGKITIGNKVNIGANAVVVQDVPDLSTVVGVPGKIVNKWRFQL